MSSHKIKVRGHVEECACIRSKYTVFYQLMMIVVVMMSSQPTVTKSSSTSTTPKTDQSLDSTTRQTSDELNDSTDQVHVSSSTSVVMTTTWSQWTSLSATAIETTTPITTSSPILPDFSLSSALLSATTTTTPTTTTPATTSTTTTPTTTPTTPTTTTTFMVSDDMLTASSANRTTAVPMTTATEKTIGISTSSMTSPVFSNSMSSGLDINHTALLEMTSPEARVNTSTPSHTIAGLSTLHFGLAVGCGIGGGLLLIIMFISIVACVMKCNRKRRRDQTEEQYSQQDTKDKPPKNKRKKRSPGGQPIGVDNIRLTPAAYGRSPVERLADKNKNAKIRRNKRGSVHELTQAFADKDDDELSQQQPVVNQLTPHSSELHQTLDGAYDGANSHLTSESVATVSVVSETGNSHVIIHGLNNNNDSIKPGAETKMEHKVKPVPSVSRRRQTADSSQLQASTLRGVGLTPLTTTKPEVDNLASNVYSQTSSLSAPSTASANIVVTFDEDEPFPSPPTVGYVNPNFQQFDPPHSTQLQQRQNQSDAPHRQILLTQNSFGESQTDVVDVQRNPLFGLLPIK